jgi:hypothetical protein
MCSSVENNIIKNINFIAIIIIIVLFYVLYFVLSFCVFVWAM